jgi:hypothetical protein
MTEKRIGLTSIDVPLLLVFSLIGFIGWLTFTGINERYKIRDEIQNQITQCKQEYNTILQKNNETIDSLKRTVEKLVDTQKQISSNIWTRQEHAIWCYEAESKNKDFKCPNFEEIKKRIKSSIDFESMNSMSPIIPR